MIVTVLLTFLLLLTAHSVGGARILGLFVHPVRSNSLFCNSVMSALAARGHHVTVYGPFPPSSQVPNMTYVRVFTDFHASLKERLTYKVFMEMFTNKSTFFDPLSAVHHKKCSSFLKDSKVQELSRSGETYDLVVTLGGFGEESTLAFGHIFNAPTVVILPLGTWSTVNYMAGNALSIAHIPDYFMFDFSNRMTFSERALNLGAAVVRKVRYHLYDLPGHDDLIQRYLPGMGVPPVELLVHNVSLTFVNTHPTVSYPQPYSPNIVPIGGIQLDKYTQPLPQDIQRIMDEAASGVIYFNLGTNIPVDTMPTELIETFISVFKRLSQTVIWKITLSPDVILPNNVHVYNWLPQTSILAHPNCRLFITHGGQASQYETLSAGVPVVGIPFISDQPYNIRMYEELGVGVGVNLFTLSKQELFTAVQKVLKTTRYKDNAIKVSNIFKDVPLSPADTLGYWVEYVIRHRGATHLRPAATQLYWYQRALLDVIVVTLTVAVIILTVILYLLMRLLPFVSNLYMSYKVGNKYKSKTS